MKKIFTLVALAISAMTASATVSIESLSLDNTRQLKSTTLQYGNLAPKPAKAPAMYSEGQTSIVGKEFVTIYNDGSNDYNYYFDVVADGDSIVLEGLAEGFDVKAAYNASTGTITIPTGVVIGEDETYGEVTLYAVSGTSYGDLDIIGTVTNDTITFNYGFYGVVTYNGQPGGLILMQDVEGIPANGKLSFTISPYNYSCPLLLTKTAENTINIVGLSSILYGKNYNVPMTFDATSNTASISSSQPVDWKYSSTGTGAKDIFYLFKRTTSGLDYNPEFTVVVSDDASVLTATTTLFMGYDTNGQGSYSGYSFTNYKIEASFNIYTAEVDESANDEVTEITVDNIMYTLDNENQTAEVVGCLGSTTTLNIPSTVDANDKTYSVVSVAAAAFQSNRYITSITIPASIETVGTDAFRNVTNLKELHIADLPSWCAINFANGNANPLYNVFPTSTSKWGNVYINGEAVTELVIPEGVVSIGRAFYGFKKLTKVTLPSTLVTIGDQTFANCTNLTEVTIPASVKSIGSAFFGCSALASITLNEGLESLSATFYGCRALTSISLPSTLNTLSGSMTFMSCSAITEITSLNTVPPTCDTSYMFDAFAETAKLMVPKESVDAYKAATGWSAFSTVEGIETSGIDSIESDSDNTNAEYYNLQGIKVSPEALTPGIYIMRNGNKATKVLVK